jgi:hypothetical protein
MEYLTIEVEVVDALKIDADVLALKYAQSLYGVDLEVVERLSISEKTLPEISEYKFIRTRGKIGASSVLFIGVPYLSEFRYKEIREFSRNVLFSLSECAPNTTHLALTLHGAGYGLDESESFEAELAGLMDSILNGKFPPGLHTITIVELNPARAKRLKTILERMMPKGRISIDAHGHLNKLGKESTERLRSVGYESASKPFIFVAMPFAEEMDDAFHYGIQGAVNAAGFLCERADLSSFTGDVMEWVKKRISNASFVIADLTTANPNVYLEVGYAWGCNKPTILIIKNTSDLKFDVKTQRCLVYKNIKDLEDSLSRELKQLSKNIS